MSHTPYEVYRMYCAIKRHFTSETYDYFKYNGKTRTSVKAFEQRNDKYFFHKLAKHKDPVGVIVSAMLVKGGSTWAGDLVQEKETEETYRNWLRRKESLTYIFKNDVDKLSTNLFEEIKIADNQHPMLFLRYLRGEITCESMIILQSIVKFFKMWNKYLRNDIVWQQEKLKLEKYSPFVAIDEKYKKILIDHCKQFH
jgi:hypothetical protein